MASQQPATAASALTRMATQPQIEFELDLFEAILKHRPEFVEVLKAHAKNLAHVRRHTEGLEVDRQIARLRPLDSLARYNLACSLVLNRNHDEAIAELRQAIELGYRDFTFMKQDRDLDSIRKDPRFRALMREFERKR
jgi:tetratricopeptide (TPR) repeat protein